MMKKFAPLLSFILFFLIGAGGVVFLHIEDHRPTPGLPAFLAHPETAPSALKMAFSDSKAPEAQKAPSSPALQANVNLPRKDLTIVRANDTRETLSVEVAETPEQQARGMMFRNKIPQGTGMLFWFDPPQPVSFWMKDTLIPLDMLFARADGVIVKIVAQAKPLDEMRIPCDDQVRAVLEIGGGQASALGLSEGDRIDLAPLARSVK